MLIFGLYLVILPTQHTYTYLYYWLQYFCSICSLLWCPDVVYSITWSWEQKTPRTPFLSFSLSSMKQRAFGSEKSSLYFPSKRWVDVGRREKSIDTQQQVTQSYTRVVRAKLRAQQSCCCVCCSWEELKLLQGCSSSAAVWNSDFGFDFQRHFS